MPNKWIRRIAFIIGMILAGFYGAIAALLGWSDIKTGIVGLCIGLIVVPFILVPFLIWMDEREKREHANDST